MDKFINEKWLHYCGVDMTGRNPVRATDRVDMKISFFVILCFIPKSVIIAKFGEQWYCADLPEYYNRSVIIDFTIDKDESGVYYMQALRIQTRFDFRPITLEDFETNLHPLPPERRMERDAVMANYGPKPSYSLPKWLN